MKTKAAIKGLTTVDLTPEKPVDPMDDYEAQNHYETMMKAHHIMNDPEKMKKVRAIAGRKAQAATAINEMASLKAPKMAKPDIKNVADLKRLSKKMRGVE